MERKRTNTFLRFIRQMGEVRYAALLERLAAKKTRCGVFYPAVIDMTGCADIVRTLTDFGVDVSCVCLFDFHVSTPGANIPSMGGARIVPLSRLAESREKPEVMFIHESYVQGFASHFGRMGIHAVIWADKEAEENIYELYMGHLDDLYGEYVSFTDDESRRVYLGGILGDISRDPSFYVNDTAPQYFLSGFLPKEGDIFIDAGSFDGNTARDFAMTGCRVYSFELDEKNYNMGLKCAERYGFVLENLGLGEYEESVAYTHLEGGGSHQVSSGGGAEGRVIDLDTYAIRKGLRRLDFIKMDIEGAELSALKGAHRSITQFKPKMAICAYHKPEDLWTLAQYIRSLRPDYEFAFRHYSGRVGGDSGDREAAKIYDIYHIDHVWPGRCEKVLYCR